MAIPEGEIRRVSQFGVFLITAIASLFAYIWMLVVLSWVSPDKVMLWEAILTL